MEPEPSHGTRISDQSTHPPTNLRLRLRQSGWWISQHAAGAKARAMMFQSLLLPPLEIVLEETETHLAQYLPKDDLAGVMEMLAKSGWEPTENVYADRAREAKRQWRDITNRNYGVRVAGDWRPDGWLADHDRFRPFQRRKAAVVDARDALAALHRIQAITEAEREEALAAVDELPGLRAALAALENDLRTADGVHAQTQNALRDDNYEISLLETNLDSMRKRFSSDPSKPMPPLR